MTAAYPARRPFLLSLVTILMIIGAILQIIVGLVLVFASGSSDLQSDSGESAGTIVTLGLLALGFGLIQIWFAVLLRRGSRIARALVLVFEVVQIIAAVWTLIAMNAQYRVNALITIAISMFVIWYLYGNQRSRAFFGDRV